MDVKSPELEAEPTRAAKPVAPVERRSRRRMLLVGTALFAAGLLVGAVVATAVFNGSSPASPMASTVAPTPTAPTLADEIPTLAAPQESIDELPAALPATAADGIISSSSRLVGADGPVSYYAAQATDGRICLLIWKTAVIWALGCDGEIPVTISYHGLGTATLDAAGNPTPDGWTRVGPNLTTRP